MKSILSFKKLIAGLCIGGALSAGFISCENPVDADSLQLILDTDFVVPVATLQVVDAKTGEAITSGVTVTKLGTDASKLYTTAGESQLVATGGVINIASLKEELRASGEALSFSIEVSAPGYITTMKSFNSYEELLQANIQMVSLTNPPTGVAVTQTSINVGSGSGTTSEISFETPMSNGTTETAAVTVAPGTVFLDEDGNAITGDVDVEFGYFDNRNNNAADILPGGVNVTTAVDESGNRIPAGTFETVGFFSLKIRSGNKKTKSFTEPVTVTMSLNETTVNPNTGNPIKAGDMVPLWSFEEGSDVWTREGMVEVKSEAGELKAEFAITHLSFYNLDFINTAECDFTRLTFNTDINYTDTYDVKVVSSSSGVVLASRTMSITNGGTIWLGYPPSGNVILKVYNRDNGALIDETAALNLCNTSSINLTLGSSATPFTVSGSVVAQCTSGLDLYVTAMTYIRPQGTNTWQFYGTFASGQFTTVKPVYEGATYDFKIVAYGEEYIKENITVDAGAVEHAFDGTPASITLDVNTTNNTAVFTVTDVEVPQDVCDRF